MLLLLLACEPTPLDVGPGYVNDWEVDPERAPVPFGFWGLNGFQDEEGLEGLTERFGLTVFSTSTRHPNYAVHDLLPLVREQGLAVNLRLVGGHEYYTDSAGNFDLEAWRQMLEPWRDSGVQEFIDDGTFLAHMLIDDIATFEGDDPTGDELDQMARISHEVLPGLKTLVREDAWLMPVPSAGRYQWLDGSVNQFSAQDGDVELYILGQQQAAYELGLELVTGLNMANGGDGSSGQPGWSHGRYAMAPWEVDLYGVPLIAVEGCRMFLAWEYDGEESWSDGSIGSDYFDQAELQEALAGLAELAAGG